MTDIKYTTVAKIFKYLAYILMGAAVVLIMLGFSGLWMGPIPGVDPIYLLLFGFLLFATSVPLLMMAQAGIIKPEFSSISLLKCSSTDCKFTRGKDFEKDEYVFKELDEKCPKCNSNLYIAAIFEVEKKPKREQEKKEISDDQSKTEEEWASKEEISKAPAQSNNA
ncbi:MAG: hypothetical protein ACTSQ8_07665 [Candidatus Helarchaeota archaeon]